ncbi:MAG: hypothetical protein N2316_07315 [Spirochaetes bacterium]|nr:hypothetical protein [Spirochaetota bacterium]
MSIKYLVVVIIAIFLVVSIIQMFQVFPFSEDIFPVYKSTYFKELDKQFEVIADAFIGIKTKSRPAYAWIFLEDIRHKHSIKINVYNFKGEHVPAPGEIGQMYDEIVIRVASKFRPHPVHQIRNSTYYAAIPLVATPQCGFCHHQQEGQIVGTLTFERPFNSVFIYGKERALIFGFFALIASILLIIAVRWDPHKRIKEIFDK